MISINGLVKIRLAWGVQDRRLLILKRNLRDQGCCSGVAVPQIVMIESKTPRRPCLWIERHNAIRSTVIAGA